VLFESKQLSPPETHIYVSITGGFNPKKISFYVWEDSPTTGVVLSLSNKKFGVLPEPKQLSHLGIHVYFYISLGFNTKMTLFYGRTAASKENPSGKTHIRNENFDLAPPPTK